MRVKITGYLELEEHEVDADSPTGMTEEAFIDYIHNERGNSPRVSDLEDVDVEVA